MAANLNFLCAMLKAWYPSLWVRMSSRITLTYSAPREEQREGGVDVANQNQEAATRHVAHASR